MLVAAGILEPERPLAFVHPIVRAGRLRGAAAGRAHARPPPRRRAAWTASRPARSARPSTCWPPSRPATRGSRGAWSTPRAPRRGAARRSPRPCYLRRALAEPPPAGRAPGLLLELGVAEATAGQAGGRGSPARGARRRRRRRRRARSARRSCSPTRSGAPSGSRTRSRSSTARPRGCATADEPTRACCSRRWRMMAGDARREHGAARSPRACRPCAARADDAARAARGARRGRAARGRHANEPADVGIALAQRAFAAGPRTVPEPTDLPWFAQATIALVWADAFDEAAGPLDAGAGREPRDRRPRPVRHEHDASARGCCCAAATCRAPRATRARCSRRPICRRRGCTARWPPAVLVERARSSRATSTRPRPRCGAFAPGEPARTHSGACCCSRAGACALAQRQLDAGLADIRAAGRHRRCAPGRSRPASWPGARRPRWSTLALGEREAARRLAREELELARAFGAPRTLGVALRAAGVVTGGARGRGAPARGGGHAGAAPAWRSSSARALAELGALLRRANRRAEARALLREGARHRPPRGRGAARRPGRGRAAGHRRQAPPRAR